MTTKTAIAIAAHPDDIEFFMAGTLMLLGRAGYELHYMNIANGCCGTTDDHIRAVAEAVARAAAGWASADGRADGEPDGPQLGDDPEALADIAAELYASLDPALAA